MKRIIFLSTLVILLALAGCSKSSDDEDPIPDDNNPALKAAEDYYNTNLKTFITNTCVSCHEGHHNQANSSNYGVFTNAKNNASGMFNQVNSGTMPKDSAKLPQADIDKFEEFRDLVNAIN